MYVLVRVFCLVGHSCLIFSENIRICRNEMQTNPKTLNKTLRLPLQVQEDASFN